MNRNRYQTPILLSLSLIGSVILFMGMINVGSPIPNFSIEDQYEKKWKKSDYTGKVTLYVVCDRDAYDHIDNWTDKLVPDYKGKINFVPIADVSPVPGLMKGYVRGKFKDEFTYPVLMDWEGVLVNGLNMKKGYPTLVIADAAGVAQYRAWGTGSKSQVDRLREKLDAVISGS